ncbi:MAG: glycosyltransferase [Desulfobacterales bacterium]|nr:MAG: glycosyltransferase [Desulfobacterales bacterium]
MKIICFAKRRPQQRDLVSRPYGRFYYLPYMLAQRGHEVTVALLSYKPDRSVIFNREGVQWNSESIFNWRSLGYIGTINSLIRKTNPDWIIGFSDTYYGILAAYFGQKYGIHFAIDAYDNYESYLQWCRPLHMLWRKAIKSADVVTAAGPQLAQYLNRFRPYNIVHIVPMAADPTGFRLLDKQECRKKLNLPQDKKLIGYCGSIYQNRGIQTVFSAYDRVRSENPNSLLILSGRIQKKIHLPANTKYLGYLSDDLVPILLNCMDVLLVPNQLTKFGNFSYPVKLYEAMTCQIPVVAAATAPAKWILNNKKQFLARPGDADDMAQRIIKALQLDRAFYEEQNTWENSCDVFEAALLEQA